jgi:hypothetical protein
LPTQEITRILSSTNLSTTSTLVNNSQEQIIFPTKQITQLLNKIEVDQKTITEELKELAREFIRTNQANPKDKTIIKSLKQELKNQGFSRNQIEKIIIICEEMIESKEEQEKTLVQQVEVLTIKE